MNLTVLGAGHIGLITSLSLSTFEHHVVCVDPNHILIKKLSDGSSDLFETDLTEHLKSALAAKKIDFTTDLQNKSYFSDVYFICVGTPCLPDGSCDLKYIYECVESVQNCNTTQTKKIVVIKSTVPPGTNLILTEKYPDLIFVSNPEFLREGRALYDALNPDRIVIGSKSQDATDLVKEIYQPILHKTKLIITDPTSAELSKYAANTFLAAKISLINEFSKFSDHFGADIKSVAEIVGSDPRIGPDFLNAGLGYGGSCFPKDLSALSFLSESSQIFAPMISAIQSVNTNQHQNFSKLIQTYFNDKNGPVKKIALWGTAFKPETNDLREASSLKIINSLLIDGFTIHVHDPQLSDEFLQIYDQAIDQQKIIIFKDEYLALNHCHAILICTEWPEYIDSDLLKIASNLKSLVVFDGRNIFKAPQMKQLGFKYFSVGQKK